MERGFQLAREAGFYRGVAEMWLKASERKLIMLTPRFVLPGIEVDVFFFDALLIELKKISKPSSCERKTSR